MNHPIKTPRPMIGRTYIEKAATKRLVEVASISDTHVIGVFPETLDNCDYAHPLIWRRGEFFDQFAGKYVQE